MDMYTRVGATTRRDMDFILRTWKEPPQGSRDPQPVLPAEITRQIENALIRFRTISFQQNQQQSRQLPGRLPPSGSRDNPGFGPMVQASMNVGPNNGPGSVANPAEVAEYMTTLQQRSGTPTFHPTAPYQPPPAIRSPVMQPVQPVAQSLPVPLNGVPPNYGTHQQLNQSEVLQSKLQNEMKQIIDVLSLQKVLAVGPPNLEIEQLLATLNALMKVLNSDTLGLSHLQTMQAELAKISDRVQRGMPAQLSMLLNSAASTSQPPISLSPQVPVPPTSLHTAAPPFAELLAANPPYPIQSRSTPPPIARLPPTAAPTTRPPSITPIPLPLPAFPSISTAFQPPRNGPNAAPAWQPEFDLISQLQAAGILPPIKPTPDPPLAKSSSAGRRFGVKLDQDSITKVYVVCLGCCMRLIGGQTTCRPYLITLRRQARSV
jgi:pre-mRNA cleavage complex 2 protein Pcf11